MTYCTNVHPSGDLAALEAALAGPVTSVRRRVAPGERFPVGVWLSARTVRALSDEAALERLRGVLEREGLALATVNAFPYGDFHAPAVKHNVFRPDWKTPERLHYTRAAARILARLGWGEGDLTMSTLPGSLAAWGQAENDKRACAENLARAAMELSRLEQETGRHLLLCLEPEPGGMISTTADMILFFKEWILGVGAPEKILRRHLAVCFDTCHASAQFEDLLGSYDLLRAAGIAVGKIQVSSSLEASAASFRELARFDEPRYLHQVTARDMQGDVVFFEDLGPFLAAAPSGGFMSARVHFHLPLFWGGGSEISTTQGELARFLAALSGRSAREPLPLLEIETYTWGVLLGSPPDENALAEGIAREFEWVRNALSGVDGALAGGQDQPVARPPGSRGG